MTDQLIPVPAHLLTRLGEAYTERREAPFTPTTVTFEGLTVAEVGALMALVPVMPKEGDVLSAAQIEALPDASVMRDEDGDVLVKTGDVVQRVTYNRDSIDGTRWTGAPAWKLANSYTITLVSLPRD